MTDNQIRNINQLLKSYTIKERLAWAWDQFPNQLVMTSSFQTQSVSLLHMVAEAIPQLPVLFLDTGFHFPETLAFRDALKEKYQLNIINLRTELGHQQFKNTYGNLYLSDPDLCCHINKTNPLQKKLDEYSAWITGVRADQTKERGEMQFFSIEENGRAKICPMLDWTSKDLWTFHNKQDLLEHPLFTSGYMSVGCAPCTRPVNAGEDERSGRWADNCKTECGIHTNPNKNEIDKS